MYAVDDLSDAIDVTREFLTPVRAGTWLRLVLVVFFISGVGVSGGVPPVGDIGTFVDGPALEPVDEDVPADPIDEEFPVEEVLIVAVVLLVVGFTLWLLFAILRAIMDFVFVESLRSSEVHIRRYGRANFGRALRLFGFRVGVGLLAFVPLAIGFFVVVFAADAFGEVAFAPLAILGLLAIPLYLLYAIVMRFTTVFVVPIMVLEERNVLAGWKRFWPTLTANWTEYAVYLLLVWIIWILVGVAIAFLAFFGVLLIGIPFGILAVIFALLGPIGLVLAAFTLLVAFLFFLLYITVLEVPVYSYLRYYALLILGDTNGELDLIPEQRAAVRGDGGRAGDVGWDDGDDSDGDDRSDDSDGDDWDDDASGWDDDDRAEDDRTDDTSGRNDDRDGWDDESDRWDTRSDWDDDDRDRRW